MPLGDIHLEVDDRGEGDTVLLLHGFTGSIETWAPLVAALRRRTVAVDLPGHGRSDAPAEAGAYTIHRTVDALMMLLDRLRLERVALLGYSLGGRIALHLALAAPQRVAMLVLESASPGIENLARREARMRSDAALAELLEREGVAAFVDRWEINPIFASQERLPFEVRSALRGQRLRNSALGLANSLRGAGAGCQEPLWGRLAELTMPVLLITGELDEAYTDMAHRAAERLPAGRLVVVPEAGHTVHLEAPDTFHALVGAFLDETLAPADPSAPSTKGIQR